MEARKIGREEVPASRKISAVAFQYGFDCKVGESDPYPFGHMDMWGAFDGGGRMMSRMDVLHHTAYLDGHEVGSAGIGGVATLPEYRNMGAVRAMISAAFGDMAARGQCISQLFPFDFGYYAKFGYGAYFERIHIKARMEALTDAAGFVRNGDCTFVDSKDDVRLHGLYGRYAAVRNGALKRDGRLWGDRLSDNAYLRRLYPYVYSGRTGAPTGYFVFSPENDCMRIVEICYECLDDIKGMLGFAKNLDRQFTHVIVHELPAADDFSLALPDQKLMERTLHYSSMARIVDVGRVLGLMRYPMGKGGFSMSVSDPSIPANEGLFEVRYRDGVATDMERRPAGTAASGKAAPTRPGGGPDMEVAVGALAMLVMGTDHIFSRRYGALPGLRVHANHKALGEVFVRKDVFLGDHF